MAARANLSEADDASDREARQSRHGKHKPLLTMDDFLSQADYLRTMLLHMLPIKQPEETPHQFQRADYTMAVSRAAGGGPSTFSRRISALLLFLSSGDGQGRLAELLGCIGFSLAEGRAVADMFRAGGHDFEFDEEVFVQFAQQLQPFLVVPRRVAATTPQSTKFHPADALPKRCRTVTVTARGVLELLAKQEDLIEKINGRHGLSILAQPLLLSDNFKPEKASTYAHLKSLNAACRAGTLAFDAIIHFMELSGEEKESFKALMLKSGLLSTTPPPVSPCFDYTFRNDFKPVQLAISMGDDANQVEADDADEPAYWTGNFYGGAVIDFQASDGNTQQLNSGLVAVKLQSAYRDLPATMRLHVVCASLIYENQLYVIDASLREVFYSEADPYGLAKKVGAKLAHDCLRYLSLEERLPYLIEAARQRENDLAKLTPQQRRRRSAKPMVNDFEQLRAFADLLQVFIRLTLLDFGFSLVRIEWLERVLRNNYEEWKSWQKEGATANSSVF